MVNSYARPQDHTCPECGHLLFDKIWLIVDVIERPDLRRSMVDGTLHESTCGNCGCCFAVDVPLIVFRPDAKPNVLISPASDIASATARGMAAGLARRLQENLGASWQNAWLAEAAIVPRLLLPAVLGEDSAGAVARAVEEIEEALATLRRKNPAEFHDLQELARDMLETETAESGEAEPDQLPEDLGGLLDRLARPDEGEE
jgi:hypothetical protein